MPSVIVSVAEESFSPFLSFFFLTTLIHRVGEQIRVPEICLELFSGAKYRVGNRQARLFYGATNAGRALASGEVVAYREPDVNDV